MSVKKKRAKLNSKENEKQSESMKSCLTLSYGLRRSICSFCLILFCFGSVQFSMSKHRKAIAKPVVCKFTVTVDHIE